MLFEELIKGLGEKLGVELFVEDGACSVGVDDMVVMIINLPEVGQVALCGEIGEPPPQGLSQLYRQMLAANHLFKETSGATISVNEEKNTFNLCRLDVSDTVEVESYYLILERFVNTLETWRKRLADYRPSIDEQPVKIEDGDLVSALHMDSSYMSV